MMFFMSLILTSDDESNTENDLHRIHRLMSGVLNEEHALAGKRSKRFIQLPLCYSSLASKVSSC